MPKMRTCVFISHARGRFNQGSTGIGLRYEAPNDKIEHYQWICPRCRRALLALAQGKLRFPGTSTIESVVLPMAMPSPVNPGLGEGPLDTEDRDNFHP